MIDTYGDSKAENIKYLGMLQPIIDNKNCIFVRIQLFQVAVVELFHLKNLECPETRL